jgi:hypothetical protein
LVNNYYFKLFFFLCLVCACFVLLCVLFCACFVPFLCSFVPKFGTEFLPFFSSKTFVPTLCLHFFNHFSKNFIKFIYFFCATFVLISVPILCQFCAYSVLFLCFFWLENYDIFGNFYIFGNSVPTLCLLCAYFVLVCARICAKFVPILCFPPHQCSTMLAGCRWGLLVAHR